MDPTPIIAKYDVKYGTEALIVPSNLNVPVDFMGRLDIDVPKGNQSVTGSINYDPPSATPDKSTSATPDKSTSATSDSTVVFVLISADSYPTTSSGGPTLQVSVAGPPSTNQSGKTPAPQTGVKEEDKEAAQDAAKFDLQFPLILLGGGAVKTLEPKGGNPTVFTFWNASQTTVKLTVRVGRRLNT